MEEIRYRGKVASAAEIEFIRRLIIGNPDASRRALSKKLCEAWNWVQPNGQLRDMVCRGFMLYLHRAGVIRLPEQRCRPHNPLGTVRKKPVRVEVDQSPIRSTVKELAPLEFRQVRSTSYEKLYNNLIEEHHYLGYCHPVGEHLKYVVFGKQRPVACFAFSSAPRHIGCRDRYIGWDQEQRKDTLHLMAYNSRFLLLPWVQAKYLASHLLGRIAKVVGADWQRIYHHPIYFLETFVDCDKFQGVSYRASNWIYMGLTTGRGKNDQTHKPNRSVKAVWGYPLGKDFRARLCGTSR
tara:strand:- start:1737 stop:2618 length:882 start_codon:yes stop_codon:yes gene_type:complete